jgi:hypothetical protein
MSARPLTRSLFLAALLMCPIAVGVVTAEPVHADDCYSDDCRASRDHLWKKLRFEGGFGLLAGAYTVSSVHGSAVGLHVDGGARAGRLALLGEYDFLGIGEDAQSVDKPIRGVLHRVGLNARYSVAAVGGHSIPIRGDFWVEGGVGNQLVQWNGGGELSRRDLSFGVGGQMTVAIGSRKPSYVGFYYAFRGLLARDPFPMKSTPTCAGPCDTATGPSAWDTGAFFNFGIVFSR